MLHFSYGNQEAGERGEVFGLVATTPDEDLGDESIGKRHHQHRLSIVASVLLQSQRWCLRLGSLRSRIGDLIEGEVEVAALFEALDSFKVLFQQGFWRHLGYNRPPLKLGRIDANGS